MRGACLEDRSNPYSGLDGSGCSSNWRCFALAITVAFALRSASRFCRAILRSSAFRSSASFCSADLVNCSAGLAGSVCGGDSAALAGSAVPPPAAQARRVGAAPVLLFLPQFPQAAVGRRVSPRASPAQPGSPPSRCPSSPSWSAAPRRQTRTRARLPRFQPPEDMRDKEKGIVVSVFTKANARIAPPFRRCGLG